jgi:hypothetical protein
VIEREFGGTEKPLPVWLMTCREKEFDGEGNK